MKDDLIEVIYKVTPKNGILDTVLKVSGYDKFRRENKKRQMKKLKWVQDKAA